MDENLEEMLEDFERNHPDSHENGNDVDEEVNSTLSFKDQLKKNFQKSTQSMNQTHLERHKILNSQIAVKSEIVENIIKHCEMNDMVKTPKGQQDKPDVFFSKKITERLVNSIHKNSSIVKKEPTNVNDEGDKRVYVVKTYSRNQRIQRTNLKNPEFPAVLSNPIPSKFLKTAGVSTRNESVERNLTSDSTSPSDDPDRVNVRKRGRKRQLLTLKNKQTNEKKRSIVLKSLVGANQSNQKRELNSLLMDEGAVEMLYAVNNEKEAEGEAEADIFSRQKRVAKPKSNMDESNEPVSVVLKHEGASLHNSKIIRRYSDCSENEFHIDEFDDNNNDGNNEQPNTVEEPLADVNKTISTTLNSSNDHLFPYNEISLKRFENFVQIVLSPTVTTIKSSLSEQALIELSDVLNKLSHDDSCKAVLLTSTGSAFCHGIDFSTLISESEEIRLDIARKMAIAVKHFLNTLMQFPKLLIAGIDGSVKCMGITILPLFDLVFASEKATFSAPYCKLGFAPEAATMFAQNINISTVKDLFYTGRILNVTEAIEKGLVTRALWHDKFQEELLPIIKSILDQSLQSMQMTKSLVNLTSVNDFNNELDNQMKVLVDLWITDECQTRLIKALNDDEW